MSEAVRVPTRLKISVSVPSRRRITPPSRSSRPCRAPASVPRRSARAEESARAGGATQASTARPVAKAPVGLLVNHHQPRKETTARKQETTISQDAERVESITASFWRRLTWATQRSTAAMRVACPVRRTRTFRVPDSTRSPAPTCPPTLTW